MKKFGLLIASILIAGVTSAYADQDKINCPQTWEVREYGSKLSHAFIDTDSEWALVSEEWTNGGNYWQTIYRLKLDGVTDPVTAVTRGQQYFNKSPLTTSAIRSNGPDEGSVYCFYEPEGSNYLVTVSNGINYGIKRKA